MRHFIEPNSFSLEEQLALLDLADRMEADPAPYAHPVLRAFHPHPPFV